eukprot:gene3631-7237_t
MRIISRVAFVLNSVTIAFYRTGKPSLFVTSRLHAKIQMTENIPNFNEILGDIYGSDSSRKNIFSATVTGGGVQFLEWLFTVPGASTSLMEGGVPYSPSSLEEQLLHIKSDVTNDNRQYCSADTALLMAESGRIRSAELLLANTRDLNQIRDSNIFSVACTASLVSAQPKKGPHRFYIGVSTDIGQRIYAVNLVKDINTRIQEDLICSKTALEAIRQCSHYSFNIDDKNAYNIQEDSSVQSVSVEDIPRPNLFDNLYSKKTKQILFIPKLLNTTTATNNNDNNETNANDSFLDEFSYIEDVNLPIDSFVYPGSFNPLHQGHIALVQAAVAEETRKRSTNKSNKNIPIIFEISAINADKPPLSKEELIQRIRQFSHSNPLIAQSGLENIAVCISIEPLFVNKSKLFPHCKFIIGSDTLTRLLDVKYYHNSPLELVAALARIEERGVRFTVGGRVTQPSSKSTVTATSTSTAGSSQEESVPKCPFMTMRNVMDSEIGRLLPESIIKMFLGLEEEEFRIDISSSEIRQKKSSS